MSYISYWLAPASVQFCYSQYEWADGHSKVLLTEFFFVPRKAWASSLLQVQHWWQRQHFLCASWGDSLAFQIFPNVLWYCALSVLSLFSTTAFSIIRACWYILLEGCSLDCWGLCISRRKQRCCIEEYDIQEPHFRCMVMNERRVTEQNRPESQLSHKKILDTIGK